VLSFINKTINTTRSALFHQQNYKYNQKCTLSTTKLQIQPEVISFNSQSYKYNQKCTLSTIIYMNTNRTALHQQPKLEKYQNYEYKQNCTLCTSKTMNTTRILLHRTKPKVNLFTTETLNAKCTVLCRRSLLHR